MDTRTTEQICADLLAALGDVPMPSDWHYSGPAYGATSTCKCSSWDEQGHCVSCGWTKR